MVVAASPTPVAHPRANGVIAAPLATASAVVTVLVFSYSFAGDDPGSLVERRVPGWLRLVVLAAVVLVLVAGMWAVRAHRPRASTGLAVATTGSLVPLWSEWSWLPAPARAGVLAAGPLAVAGVAQVALQWPTEAPAWAGRVGRAVLVLVGAASLTHLLGYNPFADPGCARTCDDVPPILESPLTTRSVVAIASLLTIVAATLAAAAVLRGKPWHLPRIVIGAVLLALGALATASALRWAGWGDVTPSAALLVLEPLAVAVVGAALCAVGIRTVRNRAAIGRLSTELSNPETTLSGISGRIREVQFAVPGDARWVDAAGHDLPGALPQDSYVVLSDESGPVLRLLLTRRADQGEILAGLTPATRLALRNAQLAAVAKAQLAEVQASQRRVVATSDAERRRIERDLHDGAQQRLISVAFHLGAAIAAADPATLAQLASPYARVRGALANLRQLAHGIFPSMLANEGLQAALEELVAASDVPATLDIQVGKVAGADVAMAAYATVAAALDSVGRPSTATRAQIAVVQDGDTLTVRVEVAAGVGIVAADFTDVADRVGALGGRFTVSHTAEHGTVTAVIPCAS